jgi:prepilin-type N-terminal cleavage/methylation domain-containing protein
MKWFNHRVRFTRLTQAFTLIELLVVVAIIAVLISILLPSLSRARDMAKSAQCLSNQKQIITAMYLYTNDYAERLPLWGNATTYDSTRMWDYVLSPYLQNKGKSVYEFLHCPDRTPQELCSYGVNYCFVFGIEGNAFYPKSMKLTELQPGTLLTGETKEINYFCNPKIWRFNTKLGNYGMLDSYGPMLFNYFYPRHAYKTKAMCNFADGHAAAVFIRDFLRNKDDMWGP